MNTAKAIKTVLLDLDDTVFDFHRAEREAITEVLLSLGIEPTEKVVGRYSEINKSRWELLEKKEITIKEVVTSRFEILFSELGIAESGEKTQERYETALCGYNFLLPGAEDTLKLLSGRYPLYAVSNGTIKVQDSRVASSGIAKYFCDIFISGRVGYDKPDKRFFDYCFERIPGLDKESTIIVVDSLSSDMRGGNNAGIITCFLNRKGTSIPSDIKVDYEIKDITELPELLEKIEKE